MKLIEILVKKQREENWKWPESADTAEAFPYERGFVNFWVNNESTTGGFTVRDWIPPEVDTVTKEQYEAALAASKEMLVNKPVAWDGQGLPPVGEECEIKRVADWMPVTIKFISDRHTIFTTFGGTEDCYQTCSLQFRPIRTEEERKRSDICDKIYGAMTNAERKDNRSDMAEAVYDAIAAGKIPGVKLEAPDED